MKVIFLFLITGFFSSAVAQIDYSQFKGTKSKISIVREFPFANAYDYDTDSKDKDSLVTKVLTGNYPEALISKKFTSELSRNINDSIIFSLRLNTRLIIEINNQKHYLVSYNKNNDISKNIVEDYILNKDLGYDENKISNNDINLLKSIIGNVNANIVFKFYNKSSNKKYPEINRLKPMVKNEQGVIDIKKLAKTIKENKGSLLKYLE